MRLRQQANRADFVTARVLAAQAGLSPSSIRRLADLGVIQALCLDDGPRAVRIFRPSEVHKVQAYYERRGGMRLLPKR